MLRLWRFAVPQASSRTVRVNLCIVLAFALVAVGMLTGTLVSAVRIDADVDEALNPQLAAIGTETVRLPVLDRTKEIVDDIAAASEPLHPALAATQVQTADIADTHVGVRADTLSIGDSVGSIHDSVAGIRSSLTDLGPAVTGIRDLTRDAARDLDKVAGVTRGLTTSVDAVADLLAGLAGKISEIDAGVNRVRATARDIRGHTAGIADAGLLRLADLLAARPDLAQPGDISR